MGTRYRYWTGDSAAPNNGVPPSLEPPQSPMFGPQFPFGYPSLFGQPPGFGPPPCFPGIYGPPAPPGPPMMCFPTPGPPPPGPGPMMCFPAQGPPPPYTPNPWGAPQQPTAIGGASVPSLANERPPAGARVNGEIAKFSNKQGHIFSKNNTTFHVVIDGAKPWTWQGGSQHRLKVYTAASSMPIDEFIEQIGAIEKAPYGTPREQVGIQEAIEVGDGQWKQGPAFLLGDPKITYQQVDGTTAYQTLEQLGWSSQRGQVGRGKPVTIAFLP